MKPVATVISGTPKPSDAQSAHQQHSEKASRSSNRERSHGRAGNGGGDALSGVPRPSGALTATLYRIKPRFQALLRPLVDRVAQRGIRPNHLTLVAVGVSALAGFAVAASSATPGLLWVVPVAYLIRMALNAMDGLLARHHDMATPGGAILNELSDVVSDALAYLPFAFLLPDQAALVVITVVLGLIAEVAALAAANGSGRRNEGPFGKSDRALGFGILAVCIAVGAQAAATPLLVIMVILGGITVRNRTQGVTT